MGWPRERRMRFLPGTCVKASKSVTLLCPAPTPILPLPLCCCCSHRQARREHLALHRRHRLPTLPSRASPGLPTLSDVAAKGTHLLPQQPLELLAGCPGPGEAGGPENCATHLTRESAPDPDGLPRDRWRFISQETLGRVEEIWVQPKASFAPWLGLISCESHCWRLCSLLPEGHIGAQLPIPWQRKCPSLGTPSLSIVRRAVKALLSWQEPGASEAEQKEE